ncbi:MAG TPA: hypothetical protein VGG39_35590 [Polyangiaceae bacterium]|jgi:hypothetical protein
MRRELAWGAAVVVLLAPGCRRSTDASNPPVDSGPPSTASVVASPPAVGPARCVGAGEGLAIAAPQDLELGDAVAVPDGYAVGLIHRTPAGRVGAVAFVGRAATTVQVVDLAPTLGDAPPPRLAVRGADLLAAEYVLPRKSDARTLAIQTVSAAGQTKAVGALVQQRDDSFAFDLAPSLVVWDEAAPGAVPRGVVRLAEVATDHVGGARDVSPAGVDAELPGVFPVQGTPRSFVVWIARAVEEAKVTDAAPADEVTGEARAQSWLEATVVDASGAPTGPVRRLTSQSGHVTAYDGVVLSGEPRPTLLIAARDGGEPVDGSGGTLLRVRVREDGVDAALGFPGDGLGRGIPSLVSSPRPWLSWVGPHEEARLLALDAEGAPAGPPSAEPLLDDALPLATWDDEHLLVGAPGDAAAPLRVLACRR